MLAFFCRSGEACRKNILDSTEVPGNFPRAAKEMFQRNQGADLDEITREQVWELSDESCFTGF